MGKIKGVLVIAAAVLLGSSASGADARVAATVSPQANSKTASIWTEVSFRGISGPNAGSISVRGERSGRHAYRRRPHSDGRGFSLVMKRRFRKSERVTVKTGLAIPGAADGKLQFRTESLGGPRFKRNRRKGRLRGGGSAVFRSRPDLRPFTLKVRVNKVEAGDDPIFIGSKKRGNAIFDSEGKPIWFKPMRSTDFRTQTWRGRPVLTWFQSPTRGSGVKRPSYVIANRAYKVIKRITPGNGYSADSHEFRLTPRNTAYITSFRSERRNLGRHGPGKTNKVADSIAQEIDLETGRVIWEWHSLDRVPVSRTYAKKVKPGNPFDYFHINSVIDTPDGNVLVSGRSTHAIYKISRRTGRVMWSLGGKKSSFRLGRRARFSWQHDAEPLSGNRISLFDNGDAPVARRPWARQSRGLILHLDKRRRRATVARQFFHPGRPLAPTQANLESLPGGNVFIGWGSRPLISEYTANGKLVFDARVQGAHAFYRAYRLPWIGEPRRRPAIETRTGPTATAAWVSWNGDSEVVRWQAFSGFSPSALEPATTRLRSGFETKLRLNNQDPYVKIVGLDSAGHVIGRSRTVITD